MKEKVKETVERFLRDVTPFNRPEDFILYKQDGIFHRWLLYTNEHCYSLVVCFDEPTIEENYFGCTVTTRRPRAGEDWTRGNDLPDGRLTLETWQYIKNAIIRYELENLSPAIRHETPMEEQSLQPKIVINSEKENIKGN